MKRTRTSMGLRRHLPNPRSALDELPSNRLVSRSQRHRKLLHHFSIVKRGAPAPTLGKGSRCVVPRRSSRIAQPAQAPHSRLAPSTSSLLTVMRPKTRSCKAQASAITEIAEGTIKNPIDLTFGDGECRNCPHDLTSLCDEESSDEDDIEDEEAEGEAEGGRVGWEGVDDDESNDDESDEDEESFVQTGRNIDDENAEAAVEGEDESADLLARFNALSKNDAYISYKIAQWDEPLNNVLGDNKSEVLRRACLPEEVKRFFADKELKLGQYLLCGLSIHSFLDNYVPND